MATATKDVLCQEIALLYAISKGISMRLQVFRKAAQDKVYTAAEVAEILGPETEWLEMVLANIRKLTT